MDGGIERHYRKKHKLKGAALQRLLAHEKQLSLALDNPHTIDLPEHGSRAIEQLPVLNGLQCPYQPCGFLTTHPNRLTSHCPCPSKGHRNDVVSCRDGLRARHELKVTLQSFSKQRFARYWNMADDDPWVTWTAGRSISRKRILARSAESAKSNVSVGFEPPPWELEERVSSSRLEMKLIKSSDESMP